MKKFISFVLLFVLAISLVACGHEAASVGIIGGADGPTAIFITSETNWLRISGLIGLIVVTILVVFMIYHRRK